MYWEWFCSLFPHRKVQDIDPYEYRCTCGYRWHFTWWQLLWMHLFEDYIHTCPQCQRKSRYRMLSHVVRENDTEEIRENNRWID